MTSHEQHNHHVDHQHDGSGLADLLDLDDQVFGSYLDDATQWLADLATDAPGRVVDIGAGTGTGTAALARRFPAADVVALDNSDAMLERVRTRTQAGDVDNRLRTVKADLDIRWPDVDGIDIAWASSSVHELADPDRLFHDIFAALHPGGLLVVVEMDAQPSFLPKDFADGLESRLQEAMNQAGWNAHPDWAPHLQGAGFEIVDRRGFASEADGGSPGALRYARAFLRRLPAAFEDRLSPDDLGALEHLLADDNLEALLSRPGATARVTRTAWAARRPA